MADSQRGKRCFGSGLRRNPDRHSPRGNSEAKPLKGCSWLPVQADPPTVARPRAGIGQPCPRPASCQKVGACRAPDFVPRAAGHFGQNATGWDAWHKEMTANRIYATGASGYKDNAAMARGSSINLPKAPATYSYTPPDSLIRGWGMLGHLSAQACEKGHPWPRLHHRRDEAQDRHASC